MFKKILLVIAIVLVLAGTGGYLFYNSASKTVNDGTVVYEIAKGTSAYKVAEDLEKGRVIKSKEIFKLHLKLNKENQTFQAGRYEIPVAQSLDTLISRFAKGDVVPVETVKLTIPEGLTLEQVAEVVEEKLLISKEEFLTVAANWNKEYWFLEGIPNDEHKLDGFLFPDTYEMEKETNAEKVITHLLNNTEKKLEKHKEQFSTKTLSVREVMTLASLVEKEARHDEDRPKIAGVITNRLDKNMKLQIDATVLAVVGHKQTVTYKDLEVDSPYNTYKYKGLPPSPIAMPGIASIEAALHPEKHPYIYYVADRETGYHHFAVDYKTHNENIDKYWKKKE